MGIKVSRIPVWSGKIDDRPGGAASTLGPVARAGADLQFVLVRRTPEDPGRGIMFVSPIQGDAAVQAASSAGLQAAQDLAVLKIEGDNWPGGAHAITQAVGNAGVSFRGLAASVSGGRFSAFLALDGSDDADRATSAIQAIAPPPVKKKAAPAAKSKKNNKKKAKAKKR
jgi:hypothetical protein